MSAEKLLEKRQRPQYNETGCRRGTMRAAFCAVCLLAVGVALGQRFKQPKADWSNFFDENGRLKRWMFKYVDRADLAANLEKYVGKYVRFVDELSVVWEQFAEYDYASVRFEQKACEKEREEVERRGYKGNFDNQEFKDEAGRKAPLEFLRFETSLFTCLVDPARRITDVERRRLFASGDGEGVKTYVQLLLGYNAYKREGGKIPEEMVPRLITADVVHQLLALGGAGRGEVLRTLREHPLLKQCYGELEKRRHPKTLYVYGRVVRVVRFERVSVEDVKEGEREPTEEEYQDLVRRKLAEGAPGEEIVVVEVCHLEPVTAGDPHGMGHLERIEDEEVEYFGYRRTLMRLPPRPHREEGSTP